MARGNESDVVLNFRTDGQVEYATTVKDINKIMNNASAEYKNHISAMGNDATATEKLRANKQKLEIQLEGAEKRTRMLREEYEKSVAETGEYSKESEKLYKQMIQSETGANTLRNSLEQVNEELEEAGDLSVDAAKKIAKIEEAGEKVKGVGEKMSVGLTAPILAIGAASLAAFNEVDEAIDTIIAKTGASGDVADSLSESFENLGVKVPDELQDVGEAIGEVNTQFGFMDKELENASEKMLQFATLNGQDVTSTSIAAKQAIEAYGLSNKDLAQVLDVVTKTAQDTGQATDSLFDKATKGAPQIKALGLTFGEGVTLMGRFEKQGVDSSAAISAMAKASGVYAKDNKTLSQGLQETIDKIQNATNETDALNAANEVFGAKGGPRMVDAIKRGALSFDDLAAAAESSGGTLEETFNNTLDPIDKAAMASNGAKLAFAKIGEQVQIALLPVFEKAIEVFNKFSAWFGSLDDGTKQTIITIAAIVAAIGPVLVVLGTLMGSISNIVKVMKALNLVMLANPVGIVIGIILALIATFVLLWTKCEWFRNFWIGFGKAIVDIGKQAFGFLGKFISDVFDGIMKSVKTKIDGIIQYFQGLITFVTGVFTGDWSKAWEGVKDIFGGIMKMLPDGLKEPINYMIKLINGFLGGLGKIKIPNWVPKIGGKGFDIPQIPMLATGGHVLNGQAIVGEAGPELLSNSGGRTTVTPLNENEKRKGLSGALNGGKIEQIINIQNVNTSSVNEMNSMNRQIKKASEIAISGMRG